MIKRLNLCLLFILIILGVYSCRTSRTPGRGDAPENLQVEWDDPVQVKTNVKKTGKKADREFYEVNSKKLGFNLTGEEDQRLIAFISDWLGTPYKYGGKTKKGTDCSGFIMVLYKEVYGIDLARSSYDIAKNSKEIKKKHLKESDLVFFKTTKNRISHVGIYISGNKFAHASSSRGVTINDLSEEYYERTFAMAGRVRD